MITKEAEDKTKNKLPIYFTISARTAFRIILQSVFENSNSGILMPSYIGETDKEGSGVFDPVRITKVKYGFYKINADLSADFDDIKQKIDSGNFKAILIIHYFGFIRSNIVEIANYCKLKNIVLIEDCAHSFSSNINKRKIGTFGDFAFFSIHKIVPTKNGGILKCDRVHPQISQHMSGDDIISINDLVDYNRSDYNLIEEKRIENYKYYLRHWTALKHISPLYPQLPEGIVPLNFPIIIEDGLREKIYFDLIEKGVITCSLYYRMIEEISKDDYPVSYDISFKILNLPVHQDTEFADIELILSKIKEVAEKYHV